MQERGRPRVALALLVMAVAACACAQIVPIPAPAGEMPGCDQTDEFAFVGETSLAAIGLGGEFGGQNANRPGMVWVTAGPVSMGPGLAELPPGALRPPEPEGRAACIQWPDGSGMAGHISDDWQPPDGVLGAPLDAEGRAPGPPIALAVLVAAATLIGVSFLAFRERRTA